jgi:hypothetical protein
LQSRLSILAMALVLAAVACGRSTDDNLGQAGPSAADPDPGEKPTEAARARAEHGESYWGVYLHAGESTRGLDAEEAGKLLRERGLALGEDFSKGELGCDVGAAEALGLPEETIAIGVYFRDEADARAFAASLPREPVGIARVQTMCRD